MKIRITSTERSARKLKSYVLKAAEFTLSQKNMENKSISILLTNNEEIAKLNRTFRNVDSPTDVLAFPWGEDECSSTSHTLSVSPEQGESMDYLGDVAISLQRAQEQAEEYHEALEDELSRLVIHGVLHLSGMRDYTNSERDEMWSEQEKILKLIKNQKC